LIAAGRVTVNGKVVREMGIRVDPRADQLRVDGRPISAPRAHTYLIVNKPRGVITTASDPEGRRAITSLVPTDRRLFPVGRLDADSEGLVLMTDDGELANRLLHPRYEHEREYRALLEGAVPEQSLQKLRDGVRLEEGVTAPAKVRHESHVDGNTWLRIILREGRKRQIRRMAEVIGHRVLRLLRVRMGPLRLGDVPPGRWRALSGAELAALRTATAAPRALGAPHDRPKRENTNRH
jgi:23S rRNA pseudouridine2605 synthase